MTRPLRTAHLTAFAALAVLLPTLFIAGLAVRKPVQVSDASEQRLSGKSVDLAGSDYRIRFVLTPSQIQFISGTYALQPDVLAYATAEPNSFPVNAQLIGPVRVGDPLPLPAANALVFYSLGHQKIIASAALGGAR